jgi:competence protein ComEA
MPVAAKVLAAIVAAVILAFIGAKAGAHAPAQPDLGAIGIGSNSLAALPVASAAPVPADPPTPRVPSDSPADAGAPTASGVLPDGRIILNVANEEELMKLPGIGPARAKAILALRQRLARFRAVEDLLRVKGIGRKTLLRIKPNVVLDRPAAADAGQASH